MSQQGFAYASLSPDDVTFYRTMLGNSAAIAGFGVCAFGLMGGVTPHALSLSALAASVGACAFAGNYVFQAVGSYLDERSLKAEAAEVSAREDQAAEHAAYQAILLAYESGALARYRDGDWLVHRKGASGFEVMSQAQYEVFSADMARSREDLLVLDVTAPGTSALPSSFTMVRHRANDVGLVEREEVLRVLHGEKVAVEPIRPSVGSRRDFPKISLTA